MGIEKRLNPFRSSFTAPERKVEFDHHPYLGYALRPRQDLPGLHVNRLGCRGPEPDDAFPSVLVLGNSTLFGTGVHDTDLLTTVMACRLPGRNVINGGVSGYTVEQELFRLTELVDSVQVEAVLTLDGYSETFFAYVNRQVGCLPYYFDRRFDLRLRQSWKERIRARLGRTRPEHADRVPPDPDAVVDHYLRMTRILADLCAGRGLRFQATWQPLLAAQSSCEAVLGSKHPLATKVRGVLDLYPDLWEYQEACDRAIRSRCGGTRTS